MVMQYNFMTLNEGILKVYCTASLPNILSFLEGNLSEGRKASAQGPMTPKTFLFPSNIRAY